MRALDRPWDRWKDRNWRGGRSWVRRFLLPRGACANRIVGAYSIAACLATAQKAAGRERRQLAGCGSARTFDVRRVNTTLHRQQDAARKQRSGRQRMSTSAAWPADADARSAMSDMWSRHQANRVARRRARPAQSRLSECLCRRFLTNRGAPRRHSFRSRSFTMESTPCGVATVAIRRGGGDGQRCWSRYL